MAVTLVAIFFSLIAFLSTCHYVYMMQGQFEKLQQAFDKRVKEQKELADSNQMSKAKEEENHELKQVSRCHNLPFL